ncbi:beta-1,3-galactosyltransferase 2-like [Eurosta solidaginis]|uniref:beta-1,3-galactosyltransferase 2-like n=1 Tax=Eurosta solidaginis TaxID=178769 RepID=UPI0035316CE6
MLERRPLWGLLILLNVCVVIWRMQEPAMLKVEYVDTANTDSNTNTQQQRAAADESKSTQNTRERLKKELPRQQQLKGWLKTIGERHAIAQQLYAGKHLLAESAEANEIAVKVTRNADDSLMHTSSYYGSSRRSNSGSFTSTSRSKHNSKISHRASTMKSTPALPLVTAATLRNTADLRATTTTTTPSTTTANELYSKFPPHDQQQLIDLHDFTYLISQPGCSRDIQALILVHSAPANEEKRRIIRDTWGNTDALPQINGVMPLRIIFLMGTVETEAQQLDIERENFENADIIQGSFVDSYRNMTYKHVMALKWFLYNCAHAQILLKVDDDVYVNTPQLLIYMQRALWSEEITNKADAKHTADDSDGVNTLGNSSRFSSSNVLNNEASDLNAGHVVQTLNASSAPPPFIAAHLLFRRPHNLLFCKTTINAQVKRSFRSKWRVTKREHAAKYYPPYCPGFAIIYSPDVVLRLYQAAQLSKYFWIDDVHITGILAQNLNISIQNAQRDILYEDDCDDLLKGVMNSEDAEFLYAWHLIQPEQTLKLWEMYLEKANRHLSTLHSAKKTSTYDSTEFNKFKSYR